jgi:hypothetical protein
MNSATRRLIGLGRHATFDYSAVLDLKKSGINPALSSPALNLFHVADSA